jgi:hypothetical protein
LILFAKLNEPDPLRFHRRGLTLTRRLPAAMRATFPGNPI